MSIFTMLLDLAINNAYAIAGALDSTYKTSVGFCEFKQRVAEKLVAPHLQKIKNNCVTVRPPSKSPIWVSPWMLQLASLPGS
jgi:hypothetical protein